jgi:hypothetical protein
MKKAFFILLIIALNIGIGKGLHLVRNGFTLRRIAAPIRVELMRWSPEADLAIEQSFRYLGRGRQCFAFESLDGNYVLKLPRTDIYQERLIPFFSRKTVERQEREKFVVESMRISFDELRDETGVLAIHIGITENHGAKIKLRDRLGIPYQIPLEKTTFVLQKKQPILMRCFLEANREKKEEILSAFIDLIVARGQKGIWNKDESFLRNYGYDGKRGYQIDIGSFYHKPDGVASIRDAIRPIKSWLAKNDPSMLSFFETTLEKKLLILD